MASLLKNQILKHLSKFTKNLSPDKLNVSAIKGEGEMSNLELDEEVLTDLLELPTWLKITRAFCNRVAMKIQWTKLKSQPICLYLDEVIVEMETCETPRTPSNSSGQSPLSQGGKYGFVDRVMDGIYVHVNSVLVKMRSHTFNASIQLSRVKVHSTSPNWVATNDLRTTRIRNTTVGEILLFKEIEWQTTRIEAAADESLPQELLTPLRLIANQAKIRIAVKKRLSDCSITSSRVILLLDDLLWVLTVTQLKAAMLYANSLKEVIERSTQQSKRLAAEKLKRQGNFGTSAPQKSQAQRPQAASNVSSADKLFTRFDVSTTSYHLVTSRFDLHLCDDTSSISDQKRHWDITGGSLQIVFFRLSVDFYPFHPAGGERKNWFRYSDNIGTRNPWVQKLFAAFREDAIKLRKVCGSPAPTPSSSATKISTTGATSAGSNNSTPSQSPSHTTNPSRSLQASPAHPATQQAGKTTRLLESCCVIKVEELTIYMVSTPNTKRTAHQKFLASDKKQLHLPPEMSILHMEYTDYYFPDGMNYPVPNANMYILVNPVRVTLDFPTLLWFQYFLYSLAHNVDIDLGERDLQEHIDIKLEALMPRIIVPAEEKVEAQPERPEAMQMQISKLTASNCRLCDKLTYDDLRKSLDKYYSGHLFHLGEFPCDSLPYRPTPWQLERHASHKDNPYIDKLVKTFLESDPNLLQRPDAGVTHSIHTNSLKMEAASDVWGLHLEQVWVEFLGVQNFRSRPVPCIEAFPLTLWLAISYANIPQNAEPKTTMLGKSSEKSDLNSPPSCQQKRGSQQEDDTCDKRPSHLPLGDMESQDEQMTESFEDSRSLLSMDPDPHLQTTDSIFLLTNFAAKMRVQMNHFQYLFLSKMTESLTKFTEELAADLALWGSTRSFVTHIPLSFPDAELAIVCPYQMHQRTFSDDFSSSIPNMSDVFSVLSSGGGGGGATAEDVAGGRTALDNTHISQSFAKNNITSENLYLTNEYTTDDIIPLNNDRNTKPLNTFTSEELTGAAQIRNQTYLNGSQLYMSANQSLPNMGVSAGNDSGIDVDRKSLQKNVKSGTKSADVKKVFSSAFSNISNLKDKLKSTFDDSQSLSDDVDSLSIRTDTSDDDDFEQLSLDDADEIPAFVHEGQSESGSIPDTYSDMDLSSIYAESSTTKGREMVCLILLKLDKSELVVQISDHGTVLSAQVSSIMIHQPGNVGYDEFYGKFSSSKGFLQDEIPPLDLPSAFPIKLKYTIPVVQPLSDTTLTETNMASIANIWSVSVSVQDFSLLFKMSGIACLTDFFQTESVPQVVPMSISVRNFLLVLNEDRPASNGASSGEVPMNCHIDQLLIKRGIDGVFYISGAGGQPADSSLCPDDTDTVEGRGPPTPSSSASFTMLMQTQTENSNLRRQCDELQRANKFFEEQVQQLQEKLRTLELQQESKHHLHFQGKMGQMPQNTVFVTSELLINKEAETENLKLQERLFALEEDLLTSNKEKESLINTLQFLQDELLRSERRGRCNTTS